MARKTAYRLPQKSIAILGEGETEYFYFMDLKFSEKSQFIIKPDKPKHSSDLNSFMKKIIKLLSDEFDEIYVVLDLDRIVTNTSEMEKYKKLKKKFKSNNIYFIESIPCFEFWFLLHYVRTTKCFRICKNVERALKKHIKDYDKTQGYLKKANLYYKLHDKLEIAIKNAVYVNLEKLKCPTNILHPKCDVYKIIEEIRKLKLNSSK